jgi:hypothetical protein
VSTSVKYPDGESSRPGDRSRLPGQGDPFEGMGAAMWVAFATLMVVLAVLSALVMARPSGSPFP